MSLKNKIILIFTSIAVIFSAVLIFVSYQNYRKDFIHDLKKNSKDIAVLGAKSIDAEKCKNLLKRMKVEPGKYQGIDSTKKYLLDRKERYRLEMGSEYQEVVEQLNRIKNLQSKTILYAYILFPTKNKNYARFLVDADLPKRTVKKDIQIEGSVTNIAHISKLYDISNQNTTKKALKEEKVAVTETFIYDEEYKSNSIMIFAPIFDKNNEYVATLGIDISDEKINQILKKNLIINIFTAAVITLGIIIIIILSSSFLTKPLKNITEAVLKVRDKDYNIDLPTSRSDEIGSLSKSFEKMAERIKRYENEMENLNRQLKIDNEELMVTLKSIGEGVLSVDSEGKIALMNNVAEKLTGWKLEEAKTLNCDDILYFVDEETHEKIKNPIREVLKEKRKKRIKRNTLLVSKNGYKYIVSGTASPIFDTDNNMLGAILIIKDITQIEKYKEEIEKHKKLESIGLLAGGIAHDFNNYLMGILGNINLVMESMKKNLKKEKIKSLLKKAEDSAYNAKSLTKQLLVFSKGGEPIKEVVDTKSLIKKVSEELLTQKDVNTEIVIDDDLKKIYADEGQIRQVLKNIIENSIEAIDEKGLITVSARNVKIKKKKYLPNLEGKYVKIKVFDNGKGIKEKYLNKIYDPFFTTKSGKNGLGLSIAFSIVKKHDGEITIDSGEEMHTEVSIYIPVADENDIYEYENEKDISFDKRVLVVEDNDIVADTLKDILIHFGCDVFVADNGKKAVKLFNKKNKDNKKIDLVILDYKINKNETGLKIFKNLKKIDPEVIAVISSGYSSTSIMSNYDEYGFYDKLEKPFELKDIYELLRKIPNRNDG